MWPYKHDEAYRRFSQFCERAEREEVVEVTVNLISFIILNFMCSVIQVVQPAVNVITTLY